MLLHSHRLTGQCSEDFPTSSQMLDNFITVTAKGACVCVCVFLFNFFQFGSWYIKYQWTQPTWTKASWSLQSHKHTDKTLRPNRWEVITIQFSQLMGTSWFYNNTIDLLCTNNCILISSDKGTLGSQTKPDSFSDSNAHLTIWYCFLLSTPAKFSLIGPVLGQGSRTEPWVCFLPSGFCQR